MTTESKADRVYLQLKREIESGALPPGEVLSENSLVTRLEASRTPIRDALRRLSGDGLVTRGEGRRAARGAPLSLRGVRELFQYRTVLEQTAVALVAEGVAQEHIAPEPLARLQEELQTLRDTEVSPARVAAFYDLAERFDRTVMEMTPNQYLARAITELRPHSARLRSIAHADSARLELSMAEHERMISALLAGDPVAAREACRHHLDRTVETIFASLVSGSAARFDAGLAVTA